MLKLMREWFHHLKFMLWIVVISFIVTMFAVWGGAREAARRGGVDARWAARVEGEEIPAAVLLQRARTLDNFYRRLYGAGYAQQRASLRLAQVSIDNLVDNRLIVREARRLGIQATTEDLSRFITSLPQFRGPDGRFIGREKYENLLRSNGLDVAGFEAEQLESLTVERFKNAVFDAFSISDREVDEEIARRNERARVAVLRLALSRFEPASAPSDADLRAHLEQHPERFRRGETRRGRALILSRDKVAAEIQVTDEEARRQYERDLAARYTRQEQRRASHILFKADAAAPAAEVEKVRRQAEKVLQQARAGADFAELAKKHSQDPGSASQGGDLGFFGRGTMVSEFESVAFSLPVGQMSELVRSSFGLHIIKVTGVQSAGTVPFEEARAGIVNALKFQRVQEQMTRRARTWTERVRAGDSLEKIARQERLEIQDTGDLNPQERAGGATTAMVQALFLLEPKGVSEPVPVPEGLAVIQLAEVKPPSLPPLEEVRARVETDWKRERALDSARQALAAAGAFAQAPPEPAALARALSGEVSEAGPFTRAESPAGVPEELRPQAFSTPAGRWSQPVADGSQLVLLRVVERPPVDAGLLASSRAGVRQSLLDQKRNLLYTRILDGLRSGAKIELNQPLIDQIDQT